MFQTSGGFVIRTISGTTNQISIANGSGSGGNPTISAVIVAETDARAGVDNTRLVTALRAKQAAQWFSLPEVFTTSGSLWDVTGIPAGAVEVIAELRGISLSANDTMLLQLIAAAAQTTGYLSTFTIPTETPALSGLGSSNGIDCCLTTDRTLVSGIVRLTRLGAGNRWAFSVSTRANGNSLVFEQGFVTLSGELTGVRITRGGSATFTDGSIIVGTR